MSSVPSTEADDLAKAQTSRVWKYIEEQGVDQRICLLALWVDREFGKKPGPTGVKESEVQDLVESLDKAVKSKINPEIEERRLKILRRTALVYRILPKSYHLDGVTLSNSHPHCNNGPFLDIWEGKRGEERMCVKALRKNRDLDKLKRLFYRRIIGWRYLDPQYVVPFLGVSETLFSFSFIIPWEENGNISEYIKNKEDVDQLQLLEQVALGLKYLHSKEFVHGNVHPGNVLISEQGTARLVDFGITDVLTNPILFEGQGLVWTRGLVRYVAPELIVPSNFGLDRAKPTKECDIHSFAMTIYEILTEDLPYGADKDSLISYHIVSGERPPRVEILKVRPLNEDKLWSMIEACWKPEPGDRLKINEVCVALSSLREAIRG